MVCQYLGYSKTNVVFPCFKVYCKHNNTHLIAVDEEEISSKVVELCKECGDYCE